MAGVQFFIDGAPFAAEDKVAPYTRNIPKGTLAVGTHTLTAVARDVAGNLTTTAVIVTAHPGVDLQALVDRAPLVVDFRGVTRGIKADHLIRL